MIGDVLVFLRDHLNNQLEIDPDEPPDDATEEKVVFVDGDKMEPLSFKSQAVTELLINVEEERVMRDADPYVRKAEDGRVQRVQPDIRLILYILFVARFKQYEIAWKYLSKIVEHFQFVRLFEREATPDLPTGIERLTLELVTLGFAEQNEVWNALRTTHHPSILYRVKLLSLRDKQPQPTEEISEIEFDIRRIS